MQLVLCERVKVMLRSIVRKMSLSDQPLDVMEGSAGVGTVTMKDGQTDGGLKQPRTRVLGGTAKVRHLLLNHVGFRARIAYLCRKRLARSVGYALGLACTHQYYSWRR